MAFRCFLLRYHLLMNQLAAPHRRPAEIKDTSTVATIVAGEARRAEANEGVCWAA